MKKISIIIPVKNGENYLTQTLQTIIAQNTDLEIIVVDDNSDDNTLSIAKSFGCKTIQHEKTLGPSIGKNTGLKHARGEFVFFQDHDDLLPTNALSILLQKIEKNPDYDAIMAKSKDFLSPDTMDKNKAIRAEPYWGRLAGAVLFRRSVFDKIGPFNETISAGEHIDLTNRFVQHGLKILKFDFVSCLRRIHNENYGKTHRAKEYQDYAKMLRERLRTRQSINKS